MDIAPFTAAGSIVIAAPAETLYDFIADMPAVGEISPQCTGGVWEGDGRGVGAFFVGSNTAGDRTWQARMRVCVADPSREFAWENLGSAEGPVPDEIVPLIRWGYSFEPVDGGTKVEETWQILHAYPELEATSERFVTRLPGLMQGMIDETLANMKARFEA
jgi:hypothetical protein